MAAERYNLRILSSHWYNWPNCVAFYETSAIERASIPGPALIGIIKAQNIQTKEIKQFIGIGKGQNQNEDERTILELGVPFYGTI